MTAEPTPASELSYNQAADELEDILTELDSETIDIDKLSARVRRAAELIRVCRERIAGARLEIERVVAELDDEADVDLDPDADPEDST
jgi:exodeoxyribonuclease VII small subunit